MNQRVLGADVRIVRRIRIPNERLVIETLESLLDVFLSAASDSQRVPALCPGSLGGKAHQTSMLRRSLLRQVCGRLRTALPVRVRGQVGYGVAQGAAPEIQPGGCAR